MTGPFPGPQKRVGEPHSAGPGLAIGLLVAQLSNRDGRARERARLQLVEMGQRAVAPLARSLDDSDGRVRWEAAKALGEIGAAAGQAGPALVQALEDRRRDIRWLAAVALIELERQGLTPLLEALIARSSSCWLREGAHHVLHTLVRGELEDVVSPVLAALEDVEPALVTPNAAHRALEALQQA